MSLRRELLLTLGALLSLNLALAFGSIALLARMGPAIEHILQENVYSIAAAEEILAELAAPLPNTGGAERLRRSLDSAERNVTEAEEGPVIRALEETWQQALAGDGEARLRAILQARELMRINRDAMLRADDAARRSGSAGAWAAVLIGLLSFLLGLFALRRLQRRWVAPIVELNRVLDEALLGDGFRRCRPAEAPTEVVQVANAVNALLDERRARGDVRAP